MVNVDAACEMNWREGWEAEVAAAQKRTTYNISGGEYLRFALSSTTKAEDVEASYRVLRLMTTMDVAPNFDAWRTIQKIVARVNGKVAQVTLDPVLNGSFVQLNSVGTISIANDWKYHDLHGKVTTIP